MANESPRVAVVLATDSFETLRPVIAALRSQTVSCSIEIVIAAPAGCLDDVDWTELTGFFHARTAETSAPLSLSAARAAGVRAASAPIVFLGETHCFPEPEMIEQLVAAFDGEACAAVLPAIVNANPVNAVAWASYLTDYGAWGAARPGGLLQRAPVYNGAYRRAILLELGDRLSELLDTANEELWAILQRRGYHARFEPVARTRHVNVAQAGAMFRLRFLFGLLIGGQRARRWSTLRRIAYIAALPIVAAVLTNRVRATIRFSNRDEPIPHGTLAWVALGALTKVAGEAIGYVGIRQARAEERLTEIELHKARYARAARHANA